jgi:hypothetical protein
VPFESGSTPIPAGSCLAQAVRHLPAAPPRPVPRTRAGARTPPTCATAHQCLRPASAPCPDASSSMPPLPPLTPAAQPSSWRLQEPLPSQLRPPPQWRRPPPLAPPPSPVAPRAPPWRPRPPSTHRRPRRPQARLKHVCVAACDAIGRTHLDKEPSTPPTSNCVQ